MSNQLGDPTSPADQFVAVSPSDTVVFAKTKGLYVGGTGSLTATGALDGVSQTFNLVIAGNIYPLSVTKVSATGTSASNIMALY